MTGSYLRPDIAGSTRAGKRRESWIRAKHCARVALTYAGRIRREYSGLAALGLVVAMTPEQRRAWSAQRRTA